VRKKIRIVYTSTFKIPGIKYPHGISEELMAIKDPDTEVAYQRAPDAFVHFVEQNYEADLVAVQSAREAWKAEQEGELDAICLGCSAEPGVKAARELCDVLVMGAACAVQHVASMLGRKFSYIIGGGEGEVTHGRDTILSTAEQNGLSHKLASIRCLNLPPMGFNEALLSEDELNRLKEDALLESKKAIYEDGAEVIIGYGGPKLHDYLVENLKPLGVPVLSISQTLLKVTEMLVRLGLTQSKRTYPKPRRIYDFAMEQIRIVPKDSG